MYKNPVIPAQKSENDKPLSGKFEDLIEKHPHLASFFTYTEEDLISEQEVISKKNVETELRIIENKEDKGQYKLDKIEYATSKLVPLGIYKDFFRSAGNPILILLTSLSLNIIYALIIIGFDYWIKLWTEAEDQKKAFTINGNVSESTDVDSPSVLLQNRRHHLLVLFLIAIFQVLFSIPTVMFDMSFCLRAARNLHDRMFRKLLHAPIKFFNCNPIGK
ncbi:Multidrug resistance-associated protein 5 [Nymphon striatum]|nr:Multidrug resistance-associated protein 5 [Nymphon striatum]